MFLVLKISFKQLFSKSLKPHNKFIIYFSLFSLTICLSTLTIISSFSKGFNYKINQKIASIDGHYRVVKYNDHYLNINEIVEIKKNLKSEHTLLLSEYLESYAIIKIKGKSEGLAVYGLDRDKISDIFNVPFDIKKDKSDLINMSIGKNMADKHGLKMGDSLLLFSFSDFRHSSFKAHKIKVSGIFNSGFPEYDKSISFVGIDDARKIFDKQEVAKGVVGTVKSPTLINEDFSDIFQNIDLLKYNVQTWSDRHANISKWLASYSRPMLIVSGLLLALAVFNALISLWILLEERSSEIVVLRAIGLSKIKLASMIVLQNMILTLIGIFGSFIVSGFIVFIQSNYKVIQIPESVYFIDYIPVLFEFNALLMYYLLFFLGSFIVSLIPAYKLYCVSYSNDD